MLKLARWPPTWEKVVHIAVTDDVFAGDLFCVIFSHMASCKGSEIELC